MNASYQYTPVGFGSTAAGTASEASLPLPSGKTWPADIRRAQIYVGGAAINYRDDGTAPIAETAGTSGYPVAADSDIVYDGDPSKFQFIGRSGSGTATLSILYYG